MTNLPLLFASTALAPLEFMSKWLQVVASLNPLTYAIEPIRYIYMHSDWALNSVIMHNPWFAVNFVSIVVILLGFDALILLAIQPLLKRRFT